MPEGRKPGPTRTKDPRTMIDARNGCEGEICSGQRAVLWWERESMRGASRTIEPSVHEPPRCKGCKGAVCFGQEAVLGWHPDTTVSGRRGDWCHPRR